MLSFDQTPSLPELMFLRKHQVKIPQSDEALLRMVDEQWKAGCVPDLQLLVDRVSPGDPDDVIPELVMMDMEWRWKTCQPEFRVDLRYYDSSLRQPLPMTSRATILCREFGIRNRWGDCISRQEICERHPDLRELFLRNVEKEIRDIAEWPTVSVIWDGQRMISKPLDRVITAGRQTSATQVPWTFYTSDFAHHLVLCEMQDPSLSREQLEIRLSTDRRILIRNTSRSRAIAFRKIKVVIDAGQTHICEVRQPITIHLLKSHSLLIQP